MNESIILLLYHFLDEDNLIAFLGGPQVVAEALRLAAQYDLGESLLAFLAGIRFERDLPGQFELAPNISPNS